MKKFYNFFYPFSKKLVIIKYKDTKNTKNYYYGKDKQTIRQHLRTDNT